MVFISDFNFFNIFIFQKKKLLMEYISTRNNQKIFTFKDIFLKGLADDGGLFIPKSVKPFSKEEINNLKNLSYNDLAAEIIYFFFTKFY